MKKTFDSSFILHPFRVPRLSDTFSYSEEELMAKKQHHTAEPAEGADDVSATVHALTQVAQSLTQSATQMMQTMQAMQHLFQGRAQVGGGAATAGPQTQINTWGDDPYSEETPTDDPPLATPIKVPVPVNNFPLLQIQIIDRGPPPGLYDPGSANFRYWVAFEALTRGINFWGERLPPGTRWTTLSAPMQVNLAAGEDLNANYSRQFGLRFYQDTVQGVQIFSGESPDVSCHELGHAILDAVRPELFDAASIEVASFHESFGDMSAILSALQLDAERELVFAETEGHLNVNSRLSRLAEQLGWAIRQLSPTAADPDCLRNAANRFFYRDPDDLPPSAPASQLASEPHSFSRVFTGAFLDALARMLTTAGQVSAGGLRTVSRDLGQLLIDGVRLAPITSGYYSQVAAAMIQADQARFNGRYRTALSSAFIQHGILAPSSSAALTKAPTPQMMPSAAPPGAGFEGFVGAAPLLPTFGQESEGYRSTAHDAPQLPTLTVATQFGMDIEVLAPAEPPRFNVVSAALGAAAAAPTRAPKDDARAFVEDLIQNGHVDFASVHGVVVAELAATGERSRSKKTHTLVADGDGKMLLKRLHFNCGCRRCR